MSGGTPPSKKAPLVSGKNHQPSGADRTDGSTDTLTGAAPDFSVAAVGYRVWGVKGPSLTARHRDDLWPSIPDSYMTAQCAVCDFTEDPGPPGPSCRCGIHAHWRVDQLPDDLRALEPMGLLAGAVVCWGRFVPHHNCFRAQKAQVVALCGCGEVAKRAADQIQVDRVMHSDPAALREVALQYGEELPIDLRPPVSDHEKAMYEFINGTDKFRDAMAKAGKAAQGLIQSTHRTAWQSHQLANALARGATSSDHLKTEPTHFHVPYARPGS